MTPRLARALVVAAAAAAVLVAALTRGDAQTAASEDVVVRYVYSTDASDELLEPLVERFNDESHTQDGREITVQGIALNSGAATDAIRRDGVRAALWTPASSLWGRLLNHYARDTWAPESPSLVYSTQVIAMWKPLAVALGWPDEPIGWEDILELAKSPEGWRKYDLPYEAFLLGHSNPQFSTSGLSAVVSEYYAVTGKRSGLTLADVRNPEVRAKVREIERSIVRYADTVDDLTERMGRFEIPYAHAVYAQETNLFKFHENWPDVEELVPIKPSEGTFVADYPAIALDVPWLTDAERAAALTFRRWLLPKIRPALAAKNEAGFELSRPQGLVRLEPPPPAVLAEIREAWHEDRKPSNIILVVDTSDSMAEEGRLRAAKKALLSFLDGLAREDRVALVTSRDDAEPVQLVAPASGLPPKAVRGLVAAGEQPVYPAITRAVRHLRGLNQTERINAVVVISDGQTGAPTGLDELMQTINEAHATEGTNVRVFTIAYGQKVLPRPLREIAEGSGGEFYPGAPRSIEEIYAEISANF